MEETKDLLRKLEPVLGKRAKGLWYLNALSPDPVSAHKNRELIRFLADKKADCDYREEIRLPPPPSDLLAGEYRLGEVIYPNTAFASFGLREPEFIMHTLITGMTGTGKTNLAFHLLRQLSLHQKPFLVFDWKGNYRALKQLPEFQDMKIISVGAPNSEFKFNPLVPPPGVHPKHWIALLVDVIKHSFFVGHGVEYFLRKGIDQLYKTFGIYEGETSYPTFSDLEKTLRQEFVRGREMLWMSSVKRVLACLTFSGLLGGTLNSREPPELANLLNQNVILEMDNLAAIEKTFFVESLLLWIYHFRRNQAKRETFKHAIVIEEAHHVLSGKKEFTQGEESIMESVIRMIREFGEAVIAIDQEPSKLSNSILANTNCKICFNLGHGKDIKAMSQALNLTDDEGRMIDKLKVGHAMIKLKSRFPEPVHAKFPLVPIVKN